MPNFNCDSRPITRGDARERLETRLLHAQKMETVGRLAGGVAHDFNNLLTVIQSYCGFLATELPAGSAARADLDEVLKAANSAADLTRQLLAFSRKQTVHPRRLDVRVTITSIVSMLRRVLGEDIRIETDFAPTTCSVLADPSQIEQALMNLAVNARDAMPNGGTLHLRTATVAIDALSSCHRPGLATGTYVSIVVEDTGVGIPAEIIPHIFEAFYTTKGEGTGLGLATVHGIVTRSGGDVQVESAPGRGSRFTVLLPFHGEQGAASVTTEIEVPPDAVEQYSGAESILVVEDEPRVRGVIRRMLERLGYTVLEAATGAEALRVAAALPSPPDLVLTDVIMPELNGRALAEHLHERWPALNVLFMSGYTEFEIRRRALLDPRALFLEKPLTLETIGRAVRGALDSARAE